MRIRRILRVVVVAGGIVLVLLIAAIALINTRAAKHLAFEQIQKFLASHDVAIEATDFDFGFMPLRISAGRIAIYKSSSPDLPRFFTADHLSVSIRVKGLFRDRYRVERSLRPVEPPWRTAAPDGCERLFIDVGREGKTEWKQVLPPLPTAPT